MSKNVNHRGKMSHNTRSSRKEVPARNTKRNAKRIRNRRPVGGASLSRLRKEAIERIYINRYGDS